MKYIITDSTDGKYIGTTIEFFESVIMTKITDGFIMEVDVFKKTGTNLMLANSNYIIYLKEV